MIVNPLTKQLIDGYARRPSSTLLIVGDDDDGVHDIVTDLLQRLLSEENRLNVIDVYPEENKGIAIEQVRDLRKQLSTKLSGITGVSRVAVIWSVETASLQAQNALLRLTEEPVANTLLVLQTKDESNIAPTILSRSQVIRLLPITKQQAGEYGVEKGIDEKTINKYYLISRGKSASFQNLILNADDVQLNKVNLAKAFLQSSVFDRLQNQKTYSMKQDLEELITSLESIASAGLRASSGRNLHKWKNIVQESRACRSLLQQNALTKLVYTRLCVNL